VETKTFYELSLEDVDTDWLDEIKKRDPSLSIDGINQIIKFEQNTKNMGGFLENTIDSVSRIRFHG
jgi:hypothetical protein